jgi:hypothetical protein
MRPCDRTIDFIGRNRSFALNLLCLYRSIFSLGWEAMPLYRPSGWPSSVAYRYAPTPYTFQAAPFPAPHYRHTRHALFIQLCYTALYFEDWLPKFMPTELSNLVTPEIRDFLSKIGKKGGRNCMSSVARSLAAKRTAARRWRLRRARYGENGRRDPQPGHLSLRQQRADAKKAEQSGSHPLSPQPISPAACASSSADTCEVGADQSNQTETNANQIS